MLNILSYVDFILWNSTLPPEISGPPKSAIRFTVVTLTPPAIENAEFRPPFGGSFIPLVPLDSTDEGIV